MEFEELLKFIKWEHDRLGKYYKLDQRQMKHPYMLKIVEEVGELSEGVLKSDNFQRNEKLEIKSEISHEFADVLITTLILAENMGVDIKRALSEKIEKIKKRKY